MFSRRKPQAPSAPADIPVDPAEMSVLEQTLNKILDTLNAVTRLLGRHAFETSERSAAQFEQACEGWSRHILVGGESPDAQAAKTVEDLGAGRSQEKTAHPDVIPLAERDWNGLYHFLQHQRLLEKQAVTSTTDTLRSVVVDSLDHFDQLLTGERAFSGKLEHALQRLQNIAEQQPNEAMRAEIQHTVRALSNLAHTKAQASETQLEQMRTLVQSARQDILALPRENVQDELTGLHNRGTLEKALERLGKYAAFVREDLALMLVDVDNLKQINDLRGQAAGDALLRGIGRSLVKAFPSKDDFVARFGGDEFAIILSQTDADMAMRLAQRCVELFRRLDIPWEAQTLSCTVSIGVADYRHQDGLAACLSRADAALYEAKRTGRNRCAYAGD